MTPDDEHVFLRLLDAIREERITDAQSARLRRILHHNPEAEELYVNYMVFCADLKKRLASYPADIPTWPLEPDEEHGQPAVCALPESKMLDWATQQAQLEAQQQVHKIELSAEKALERYKLRERQREEERLYREYLARRRGRFVTVTSLVALIAITLFAWIASRPPATDPTAPSKQAVAPLIGSITKSVDAHWYGGLQPAVGSRIAAASVRLQEGIVEITCDNGAAVILQAPCDLRFQSPDRLFLGRGVVSATVPKAATGFTILTPRGKVVDHGTAFGLCVHQNGVTEAHVHQGAISLEAHTVETLTTGQAAAIEESGVIRRREYRPTRFLRSVQNAKVFGSPGTRLDLTDVVKGGNGFGTSQPEAAVRSGTANVSEVLHDDDRTIRTPPIWAPVTSSALVDSVFIPNGARGPVQVTRENHTFAGCPPTTGKGLWGIGYNLKSVPEDLRVKFGALPNILNGHRYGTLAAPVISMHTNLGVTFDLAAIRRTLPGVRVVRFSSLVGICQSAKRFKDSPQADMWVLLNGRVAYHRSIDSYEATRMSVEIAASDTYLTLATTDGGDGVDLDWCLFGEPALELQAVPETASTVFYDAETVSPTTNGASKQVDKSNGP